MRKVHPGSDVQLRTRERGGRESQRGRGGRKAVYAVLAILILVIVSILAYSILSNPGTPEISVSPPGHDFGDMPQRVVSKTVEVQNVGDSNLVITWISTSCGCTSATLRVGGRTSGPFGMHDNPPWGWSETLLPGQIGYLTITYDATEHPDSGEIQRIVYIRSNDPARPEVEIEVIANVIP
ncbi:MAG: DUF1573 domain-containing protein [Thermoplasmata archaeon]